MIGHKITRPSSNLKLFIHLVFKQKLSISFRDAYSIINLIVISEKKVFCSRRELLRTETEMIERGNLQAD